MVDVPVFTMPSSAEGGPFTLLYFPIMAKGLGPVLVAEFSGLSWQGPATLQFSATQWGPSLKSKGESPFGQLPLLEVDGLRLSQTGAIINYIGKKAKTEGTGKVYAMSQMLLCEAEDIFKGLQSAVQTKFVHQESPKKGGYANYVTCMTRTLPAHFEKLESLLGGAPDVASATRGAWVVGETPGELYLWSMLHQVVCCEPDILGSGKTPLLNQWYVKMLQDGRTKRVLQGDSSFGPMAQYFQKPTPTRPGMDLALSLGAWAIATLAMMQGRPTLM